MTEAEFRALFGSVEALKAEVKNLLREMERLALRVRALEGRIAGASNGRRLRDRALPWGRDGLLVALIGEGVYRLIGGG